MDDRIVEPATRPAPSPIHESLHISTGGVDLFSCLHPVADPVGIVVLTHGLSEHSGRYEHVIEYLQESRLNIFRFDLRGHGRSSGQRGHTPSYEALMDDLALMTRLARDLFPDLPLILYGHSLGGNLVANYCLRRPAEVQDVRAVVLSSPWLSLVQPQPLWKVRLINALSLIAPRIPIPAKFRPRRLMRDLDAIKRYKEDGLVHHQVTVRMAAECYSAATWAKQHAGDWKLPLLCTHGTADSITAPRGTVEFAERAPGAKLILFDDLVHEPHNEPQWRGAMTQIRDWIVEQIDQRSPSSAARRSEHTSVVV